MIYFRVKKAEVSGQSVVWVPDHPEVQHVASYADDGTPVEIIRASLFATVNEYAPNVYTLVWDSVPDYKADKIRAINARTEALIAGGFVYQSVRYPLGTMHALHYMWLPGLVLGANIVVSSFDDSVQTSFDSFTLPNFIATARAYYNSTILAGTTLKKKVVDATTIAAIDAVKDTR